jgi:hypothetical protein
MPGNDAKGIKFKATGLTDVLVADGTYSEATGFTKGQSVVAAGFTLEPKFTGVTPNTGSWGGTRIVATVHGIGMNT